MDLLAKEQKDRYEDLKGPRDGIFMPQWQSITNYCLPQMSNVNTQKTEGVTGWTDRIYDTTAIQAAQICRAGQLNRLTPASEPWAAFEPPEFLGTRYRHHHAGAGTLQLLRDGEPRLFAVLHRRHGYVVR